MRFGDLTILRQIVKGFTACKSLSNTRGKIRIRSGIMAHISDEMQCENNEMAIPMREKIRQFYFEKIILYRSIPS